MIFDTGEVGSSGIDTGDIGHSLRCRASVSAKLTRAVVAGSSNTKKWTAHFAVKRGSLGSVQVLYSAQISAGSSAESFYFNASDQLQWSDGGAGLSRNSTMVFRDVGVFYFITIHYDSANATDANRIRVEVNGVQITFTGSSIPQNKNSYFTTTATNPLAIGGYAGFTGGTLDGYLARFCMVDGSNPAASSFIYFNADINEWVTKSQSTIKAVVDAGGANSFMLDFDNGTSLTTLGYDKSTKGNNWTLNNFSLTTGSTYDWMLEVPGNSYATLNSLYTGKSTLSNANLTASGTTDLPTIVPESSYGITWYFEISGISKTWTPPAAFPSAAGDYNFGQRSWQSTGPTGAQLALCQANLPDGGTVTVSGTFTGNASTDGPFVWMNGAPKTLTINGNAVTFGTHADKLANGFKIRTSSSSYNASGSNTWTATIDSNLQNIFKYNNAEGNP